MNMQSTIAPADDLPAASLYAQIKLTESRRNFMWQLEQEAAAQDRDGSSFGDEAAACDAQRLDLCAQLRSAVLAETGVSFDRLVEVL